MTCIEKLLADCNDRDIRLSLDGPDGLIINAPQETLTPDLIGMIKAHKVELLANPAS